jgi:hypothetical protein
MKRIIYSILPLALMMFFASCEKERKSADTGIFDFSLSDLSWQDFTLDTIVIDEPDRKIALLFANSIPSEAYPVDFTATFNLPEGAHSHPASGETVTLYAKDDGLKYIITAEDGTEVNYYILIRDNQLPGNGFEDWHRASGMNGNLYSEPGKTAATTIWATANKGTSIYGIYGTQPVFLESNTVAQIATGETSAVPVTSGTLFTGKFDINGAINHPTDPRKATQFGIPFTQQPDSIQFEYAYIPGSRYVHAALNNPTSIFGGFTVTDIAGSDSFTAYAVLEARDGTQITEVARAELTSGDLQPLMKRISLPFVYQSLQKPTHITVVFASSKDGDLFTGAVGSTLTIDNVMFVYN